MGWASGSELFNVIIDKLQPEVPDVAARKRIYRPIIEAFCSHDWDTLDECEGRDEAYDQLMDELFPRDADGFR